MQQTVRHHHRRSLWARTWEDRDGSVVIWQTPNVWLLAWAGFTVVSLFLSGTLADVFFWIAAVALIIWSLLEIFRGVNYYRRVLGVAVLVYVIASLLKSV